MGKEKISRQKAVSALDTSWSPWKGAGQATAEYMIMLFIAVSLFALVANRLRPFYAQFAEKVERQISEGLFPAGNKLHQFRMGRPPRGR